MYYQFLESFSREPADEVDLFDGLAVLKAKDDLEVLAMKRERQRRG
jgi:hypothetical protein